MGCLCALTFVLAFGLQVTIDHVDARPLHCIQGTFHYDQQHDSLVFRRHFPHREQHVLIPLPTVNTQKTIPVWYCWGRNTAVVGERTVDVVFQHMKKGSVSWV